MTYEEFQYYQQFYDGFFPMDVRRAMNTPHNVPVMKEEEKKDGKQ